MPKTVEYLREIVIRFYANEREPLLINLDYLERIERGNVYMKHHDESLHLTEKSRAELMQRLTIVKTQ